ncbi:MAG: 16S rRNA (cytosine(1402)-N(4))-methyltransferase RsmH, partial [Acutalibacteraceae bacterium]
MKFSHVPVLLEPTISSLNIKPDGIYVDGTAGGGGHSEEIAKRLSDRGKLISIDRDPDALKAAGERLRKYKCSTVVRGNFSNISEILKELNIKSADGILLDIGVSSYQLDTPERGFSFHFDSPLDMRMSKEGFSARELVNTYSEEEIRTILQDYGEEKFAYKIAHNIVETRKNKPIETTFELADIVSRSVPAFAKRDGHPARKTFQAIRIKVNDELGEL